MLVDILRMPSVIGLPIDRRARIYVEDNIPTQIDIPYVHWPNAPFHRGGLQIGSLISGHLGNIYKSVHISHDEQWIFETVFSREETHWRCLYTKFISTIKTGIAISAASISFYRQDVVNNLIPISQFAASSFNMSDMNLPVIRQTNTPDMIVPPVFSEQDLWQCIDWTNNGVSSSYSPIYRPIYDHVPSVYHALIEGTFLISPPSEFITNHPNIVITKDRFFMYEEAIHNAYVKHDDVKFNHPAFDDLALDLMLILPTKLTLKTSLSQALLGIRGTWTYLGFDSPYQLLLWGNNFDHDSFDHHLAQLFFRASETYCKIFNIDIEIFLTDRYDTSSVTISKNMYDEVFIVFNDLIHDRSTHFYTSFPAIALATRSVGTRL